MSEFDLNDESVFVPASEHRRYLELIADNTDYTASPEDTLYHTARQAGSVSLSTEPGTTTRQEAFIPDPREVHKLAVSVGRNIQHFRGQAIKSKVA